jgi:hypothetical protein
MLDELGPYDHEDNFGIPEDAHASLIRSFLVIRRKPWDLQVLVVFVLQIFVLQVCAEMLREVEVVSQEQRISASTSACFKSSRCAFSTAPQQTEFRCSGT